MAEVVNIIGNIVDATDTSKAFSVNLSGASTGTTVTFTSSQTVNRTLTIPDASITISGGVTTSLSGLSTTTTNGVTNITGTLGVSSGGTGTTTSPSAGQIPIGTSGGVYVPYTVTSGSGISTTAGSGTFQINNTGVLSLAGTTNQVSVSGSTGSVTLSLPNSVVINSSLTVSGLTANSFLYSGASGLLSSTTSPTNGQILIGSTGSSPVLSLISAASPLVVTNGAGAVTVSTTVSPTTATSWIYPMVTIGLGAITWTNGTIPNASWSNVTYISALGFYIAGTGTTTYATSTNGISWTSRTATNAGTSAFTYSPSLGLLIGVGPNGSVQTSTNGISWTAQTVPGSVSSNTFTGVAWSPTLSLFCVVASQTAYIIYSSDGISWSTASGNSPYPFTGIIWASGLGLFISCAAGTYTGFYNTYLITSNNGTVWIEQGMSSIPPVNNWNSLAYSPSLNTAICVSSYVSGSQNILYSTTGTNWILTNAPSTQYGWTSAIWDPDNSRFVIISPSGAYAFSSNGILWYLGTTAPVTGSVVSGAYYNQNYVAVSTSGTLSNGTNIATNYFNIDNTFLVNPSTGQLAIGTSGVGIGTVPNPANIGSGSNIVMVGASAGGSSMTGSGNTGIGSNTLQSLTSGTNNTSNGYLSGSSMTTE